MEADQALEELAASHGVELSYRDSFGQEQRANSESVVAVLRCLGAELEDVGGAVAALEARREQLRRRRLMPFNVFWQGEEPRLFVGQEPGERLRYELEVHWEAGGSLAFAFDSDALQAGSCPDGLQSGGWVDLRQAASQFPSGEHQLRLRVSGPSGSSADSTVACLVVAPVQAWAPPPPQRQWGVFAPTYALRGKAHLGVADLADLGDLVDWVGERGGHMVGTLPLLPQFLDGLIETSPYSPVSRLFWNEFYLDVTALPELACCREAQQRIAASGPAIERLRQLPQVDYLAAAPLKRRILELLCECFYAAGGGESADYQQFVQTGRVASYAQFRAAVERTKQPFESWAEPQRSGRLSTADYDSQRCRYHLYCQFRMAQQMRRLGQRARGLGLGLYLDLPVGVHSAGYDLWAEPQTFLLGCSAGAPPDVVFRGGQDWGLAPLSPSGLRQSGYAYFRDVIRHHLSCAGALRIDHVMGLQRIYCIPRGMDARSGVYVGYNSQELLALLTLESARHGATLVGEDLGTVPAGLPETLNRHQIRRMHVVECALDGGTLYWGSLTASAVASLNTHDIMPFAGWLHAADIAQREGAGQQTHQSAEEERERRRGVVAALGFQLADEGFLSREAADALEQRAAEMVRSSEQVAPHTAAAAADVDPLVGALLLALLQKLGRSDAPLVVANLEDLWLEREPQNTPGTDSGCNNWQGKARASVQQLGAEAWASRALARLAAARVESAAAVRVAAD